MKEPTYQRSDENAVELGSLDTGDVVYIVGDTATDGTTLYVVGPHTGPLGYPHEDCVEITSLLTGQQEQLHYRTPVVPVDVFLMLHG